MDLNSIQVVHKYGKTKTGCTSSFHMEHPDRIRSAAINMAIETKTEAVCHKADHIDTKNGTESKVTNSDNLRRRAG